MTKKGDVDPVRCGLLCASLLIAVADAAEHGAWTGLRTFGYLLFWTILLGLVCDAAGVLIGLIQRSGQ